MRSSIRRKQSIKPRKNRSQEVLLPGMLPELNEFIQTMPTGKPSVWVKVTPDERQRILADRKMAKKLTKMASVLKEKIEKSIRRNASQGKQ